MSTLQQREAEVVEEFSVFDDWLDRYNYLIELATDLPPIDPAHRTDQYLISGCQSRVWIDASVDAEGKMHFTADSDAVITKGIIALLVRVLDGATPKEVEAADLKFLEQIGLGENLSPTRANGLVAMIKQMKLYALAYDTARNTGR